MPGVVFDSEGEARTEISKRGLVVDRVELDTVRTPYENTVTRQVPAEGQSVPAGTRVTLWISPGVERGARGDGTERGGPPRLRGPPAHPRRGAVGGLAGRHVGRGHESRAGAGGTAQSGARSPHLRQRRHLSTRAASVGARPFPLAGVADERAGQSMRTTEGASTSTSTRSLCFVGATKPTTSGWTGTSRWPRSTNTARRMERGAAVAEHGVECGPSAAAREDDVVHQEHVAALGAGGAGRGAGPAGGRGRRGSRGSGSAWRSTVSPVASSRGVRQSGGEGGAALFEPEHQQALDAPVALDDLVGHPGERAADALGRHQRVLRHNGRRAWSVAE